MNKIEKGKILSLENVFMNLSEKVKTLEENLENSMKYDQKKILQFENQLKAFGVEMDRIDGRCDDIGIVFRRLEQRIETLEDHKQNYEYLWERIKNLEKRVDGKAEKELICGPGESMEDNFP